ncbi:MAG: tRNA (adenosine(37)-N6)-threonylcarbamoyltransferase complex dimerization subunit type 1 TsaB [Eubacteriales bacterium]|jgi:tRNA threonylcarbamoyladenosine biosynthesis protein TsaB
MRILAIDSSGLAASAAWMEDDTLLGEFTINYKKTHSQTLLPMMDELTEMLGTDVSTADAVAVSKGPGSFTGLRIGSATAKGIGLALNKPLIEVPTVDALACNLYDTEGLVVPMMDARRSQVYTGIYEFRNHRLTVLMEQTACTTEELADRINHMQEKKAVLLGDGVPVYLDQMKQLLHIDFSVAPAHLNRQRAGAVAWLGMQYLREGKTVPSYAHHPDYLRKPQAEREKEAAGVKVDKISEASERLRPADYGRNDSYE